MHYILMGTGIIFSILSIFTFSLGWEMWRNSLKTGSLIGEISFQKENIKLSKLPNINISELDGKHLINTISREDGKFIIPNLDPGQYLMNITGEFINCPQKTVNVFPSRDSDIGTLICSINENAFWKNSGLNSQLASIISLKNSTIWTTGFQTEKTSRNKYVVYKKEKSESSWKEIIIPEIHNAERGTFIYQFSSGELCLGTNGAGAIISNNNGLSWNNLKLPSDITSISYISELPGNIWLIVGHRLNVKYGTYPNDKPRTAFLTSTDQGKNWTILSERDDNVTKFIQHSSGRIIIGTDSLDENAGIYYSNDGAKSWEKSKIDFLNELQLGKITWRGFGEISELSDGILLAGSLDGKNWKGNYQKGGRLLKSDDGGKTWKIIAGDETWGSIKAILEIDKSTLLASEGSNLLWSIDNGLNWFHFGKGFGSWVNDIIQTDDKIILISTLDVSEIPKNKLIVNYMDTK